MSPLSQSKSILPAPFLFRGHPELISELDIDSLMRVRPGTEAAAEIIGWHYPKIYDPKDPFTSLESKLSTYDGLTDRYAILIRKRSDFAEQLYTVWDGNGFGVFVEREGLLDYYIQQAETFMVQAGLSHAFIAQKLNPAPIAPCSTPTSRMGRWILGYERSTGNSTILDCTKDFVPLKDFLAGKKTAKIAQLP